MKDKEMDKPTDKKTPIHKRGITEKQRTMILLVLLVFAVGFIMWTKNSYTDNFVDSFQASPRSFFR